MNTALTFSRLDSLADLSRDYRGLRAAHPGVPAQRVLEFIRSAPGCSLDQFLCDHDWIWTGTAYGGDNDRYRGEGRVYCARCAMDGDA